MQGTKVPHTQSCGLAIHSNRACFAGRVSSSTNGNNAQVHIHKPAHPGRDRRRWCGGCRSLHVPRGSIHLASCLMDSRCGAGCLAGACCCFGLHPRHESIRKDVAARHLVPGRFGVPAGCCLRFPLERHRGRGRIRPAIRCRSTHPALTRGAYAPGIRRSASRSGARRCARRRRPGGCRRTATPGRRRRCTPGSPGGRRTRRPG